jgi:thermitase
MRAQSSVVVCLLSSFLLLSATPALAQGPPSWVADEILVGIRPGVDRSQARAAYRAAGASLIKEIPQIGVHRLRVAPAALEAVERTLRARGDFAFVERNRRFPPIQVPNDPLYGSQWHLPKIGAAQAWDLVPTTPGAVIAILDSGVDPTHEDLVGKLVPGFNTYDDDTNTADVFGHGTKVAGAAGAKGNNGLGVASVAWESPIMPIRVTDTAGYGYSSTLSEGLVYAVDNGAAVMNMSFGGVAGSAAIRAAAQYAMEHGGLVVAASGNCGCLDSTADTPYLLSVSATDYNDDLASFSSRGNYVDLAAPGVSIYTTRWGGSYGKYSSNN